MNLLVADVKISIFRDYQKQFNNFFVMEGDLVACNNVNHLMATFGIEYESKHLRLFIDSSKTSLKCVLLHNANSKSSVLVGYELHMKESYVDII